MGMRGHSQGFDDPALRDAPARAFIDHPRQLVPKGGETCQPLLYLDKPRARDCVRRGTRLVWRVLQLQERSDRVHFEAELPRVPDEREAP